MLIKDLCESERPRERLLAQGAEGMGNGELLAILLRTGGEGEGAVGLAHKMLAASGGSLTELFKMSSGELQAFPGIGPGKAATILAAFELGRRFLQESTDPGRSALSSARMVYDLMLPRLKGLDHEECWAIWLDRRNFQTGRTQITSGGPGSTTMDVGQVCRMALERRAAGIFLVHNHPSGDPRPSRADIERTRELHNALKTLDIALVDHVIVAASSFYSFFSEEVFNG